MDAISSLLFGLESNALHEPDSQFVKMGYKFFESRLTLALSITWPGLAHQVLGLLRFQKEVTSFYDKVIKREVRRRDGNGVDIDDVLGFLMNLREKDSKDTVSRDNENFFGNLYFFASACSEILGKETEAFF